MYGSHINWYNTEQESERSVQEFSQKMESLKREHELEMESLVHEAQLKQKDAEVSNFIAIGIPNNINNK